jgi:hypothetical protein
MSCPLSSCPIGLLFEPENIVVIIFYHLPIVKLSSVRTVAGASGHYRPPRARAYAHERVNGKTCPQASALIMVHPISSLRLEPDSCLNEPESLIAARFGVANFCLLHAVLFLKFRA